MRTEVTEKDEKRNDFKLSEADKKKMESGAGGSGAAPARVVPFGASGGMMIDMAELQKRQNAKNQPEAGKKPQAATQPSKKDAKKKK